MTFDDLEYTKGIGEMTEEEVLEEYRRAEQENLKTSINFIEVWMKINNYEEKYPEYFL